MAKTADENPGNPGNHNEALNIVFQGPLYLYDEEDTFLDMQRVSV